MACLPNTPVATNVLTATNTTNHGYITLPSVITTALSQYYPLSTTVISFDGMAHTSNQHLILRQLQFEETAASSADVKKTPLLVLLYTTTQPTAPTSGAVYNGSVADNMAIVSIAQSDYKRLSDTVWIATVNPNQYLRTGTLSTATTIYAVVLSNSGTSVTYASGAAARVRLFTEAATAY